MSCVLPTQSRHSLQLIGYVDIQQIAPCSFVLWIDSSQDTMVKRLVKRGETSGRADDNEETIRKRLQTFVESTEPVITYYEKQDKVKRVRMRSFLIEFYYTLFEGAVRSKQHPPDDCDERKRSHKFIPQYSHNYNPNPSGVVIPRR